MRPSALVASESSPTTRETGLMARVARRLVHQRLRSLSSGRLVLHEDGDEIAFGPSENESTAVLRVHRGGFYRSLVLGGSLGAAESYLRGDWDCDDLTALVRLMARNRDAMLGLEGGLATLGRVLARLVHWTRANTIVGSRRNIRAHYDLGNDLFESFLDPSMTYSCAYFEDQKMSLGQAQTAKIDRLCKKLRLGPSDHLLEIGTGWGSLAIHAARTYGCRVTTTTISPAQYAEASRRVTAAGLDGCVRILLQDYRDLEGTYDKLVSVEMIEAVGHEFVPLFFETCGRLLAPGGLMALQAITIADRNYEAARHSVDFIQRYIFPGGALPSVSSMAGAVAAASDLTPLHLEEMGLHYAETLRRWRRNFDAAWPRLSELGYDGRFRRLWHYYLAYCEGGFEERVIGLVQMTLAKPGFRGDSVRGALP